MARRQRWTLIPVALALAGVAWLALTWITRSQAIATEPPPPEMSDGDIEITWKNTQPINLSRSQEREVSYSARFPRIVVGPDRAYVTWEAVYNGAVVPAQSEALMALSEDYKSWPTPLMISESLQTTSEHANFVQGTDGDLHLVWQETREADYQFMYQRRSSTGVAELTEVRDELSELPVPVVGINGSQNVHLTWLGVDPSSARDVFHTRSENGGDSWFFPTRVVTLPSSSLDTAIALDDSNQAHVAWMEDQGASTRGVIMYRMGTPVGEGMDWGAIITPSAHMTDCFKPSIVVTGSEAYIGWGKALGTYKFDLYFARCSALTCTTPITLGHSVVVNKNDPGQSVPVLAIDEHGTLAAVWHGDQEHDQPGPDTYEEVLFTYSSDGGTTWAEVQNVSQTPGERSIDPHLVLVDGVAHVVWKERYSGTPQKYDVWYVNSDSAPFVYLPLVLRNY